MQNYELSIDPVLAREAQSVFQELGTNLPAAVAVFLRRTVNRHAFPFPAEKVSSRTKNLPKPTGAAWNKFKRESASASAWRTWRKWIVRPLDISKR